MEMQSDNGVLGFILADETAVAMRRLPEAGRGQPARFEAETDSIHKGRVMITFRLMSHKRGKSVYWFWSPCHARQIT